MKVTLKVASGANAGREIPMAGDEFVIGRDPACHLRPKSDEIARRHCVLAKKEGTLTVRDESGVGTFVNEKPIDREQPLKTGDRLRVGPLVFELLLEFDVAGKKLSKVKDVREAAARAAQRAADQEDDGDIASWLNEQDANQEKERYFSLNEIKVVKTEEQAAKQEEEEKKAKKKAEKEKEKEKKQFGKLPKPDEIHHEDTRAAATDMLKKFFGGDTK